MKKRWITLLLASLLTLGVSLSATSAATAGTSDDEALFIALINDLRASKGLAPLSSHPDLRAGAASWTATLVNNGELSHAPDLSAGVTVNWAKLGENVGVASAGQTQQLFDAFVASPSHYQNLVDPDFAYIGVAVMYDDTGRMWTTHRFMKVFANTVATPPPTTAPAPTPTTVPPAVTAPSTTPAPAKQPTTPTTTTTESTSTTVDGQPAEQATGRPAVIEPTATPLDPTFVAGVLNDLAAAGIWTCRSGVSYLVMP
ncbi:MAG: CAP domain-containing protein [Acidimicrobiales bacterium]